MLKYKDIDTEFLQMRFLLAKKTFLEQGIRVEEAYVRADVLDILTGQPIGFSKQSDMLHGVRLLSVEHLPSMFRMLEPKRQGVISARGGAGGTVEKKCLACLAPAHRGLNYCLYHATTVFQRESIYKQKEYK